MRELRPDQRRNTMERIDIVVGFDGSAPSRNALRYAVTQARRKNAPVRVRVCCTDR
jgi:hypothetical protein